ncbi:peptide MFS transporter [Streptomyces mobaraensis]|uniref:MFS transporter n=1 Tax=Streptomyces mobaraensis TaxID=35621 RepID=A0A5N5WB29_STRMB|nr:oligopeptide:H+ symporter [Streptomyces mobaraensis]KAB7846944.1 MFS transporter [Streptomyces mobaraensis]
MASTVMGDAPGQGGPAGDGKTFFGHPRGLATLFMTELWERFSYYGMRALLVYYLISGGPDGDEAGLRAGGLAMSTAAASSLYAVYLAMVYLLALPGGWFGDRVWGPRKAVVIGSCVITAGHLTLALPGAPAFFLGLTLVALGSGLLKANISTMVGYLYAGPRDPRRDGGFTLFYVGINLGAFGAPFVIGTVGETVSWHAGFALAGVGMALGAAQFLAGTKHLAPASDVVPSPVPRQERARCLLVGLAWLPVAAVFYGVVVATGIFSLNWLLVPITILGLIAPTVVLVRVRRNKDLTPAEQARMTRYIWFFVAAAVFWMIYDQGGSTLAVFGKGSTTGELFGVDFPAAWFQSLNPLFVMALAPLFSWLWPWLARRDREPGPMTKFAVALLLIGGSFAVLTVSMALAAGGARVSPMWLVSIYLVQAVGELCLSPVGLSVTTKLAPARYGSQMLGVWFLAVTAGNCCTSLLGIAGIGLDGTGGVVAEAALATAVGLALFAGRGRVR